MAGTIASCQSWRDAKEVIAEADSLLAKGVIMRDTVMLADAIRALDNHAGQVFAREELAKAYYLMGRNLDDYHHNFADAADYYIKADRLKTKDLILRGRINSCMGYLCKQDSCFEEALVFYERANEAFEKSGDERRIANGLLSIAECYMFLHQYAMADSLLHVAEKYCIDSVYYARMIETRGMYYYEIQQYDSALVCLEQIIGFHSGVEENSFACSTIIQILYKMNLLNSSLSYATYIIEHSQNPCYLSNAYYVLIKIAEQNNDGYNLAKYSYFREDIDRELQHNVESYAQATVKLRDYITNPYPLRYWGIAIIMCLLFSAFWVVFGILYRKRTKKIAQEKMLVEAELHQWQEQMREKLAIEEANVAAKRKIISDIVMMHAEEFAPDNEIWKDEKELYRLANSSFGFVIYRLRDTYRNLNDLEVKICLMVLLEFSNKMIANIACCSEESISTIKQRLSKKLSTSPREIREFLMDFIMKFA